jgi:hypothetical protein
MTAAPPDVTPPPAPTGSKPRTSKLVSILVTAMCVVVAGIGVKFAPELTEEEIRRGTVGETISYYRSEVTVTDVRSGTRMSDDIGDDVSETPGLFLAVTLRMETPIEEQRLRAGELRAGGGLTYKDISSNTMSVPAGFSGTSTVIFEVDPHRMDDLYLRITDGEIFYSYPQVLHIDLGITDQNAADWIRAGQGQTVQAERLPEMKALP